LAIGHYSPVLNGIVNATTHKIVEVPGETAEKFELLVDFISKGTIPGTKDLHDLSGQKANVKQCIAFLEVAEEYSLGDASELLYDPLHKALKTLSLIKARNSKQDLELADRMDWRCGIEDSDIEGVFHLCPAKSPLRALIAQAALSYSGPQDLKQWEGQMNDIPGFAVALIEQCISGFARQNFRDPFTKREKRVV
jgi:hypothetical protein